MYRIHLKNGRSYPIAHMTDIAIEGGMVKCVFNDAILTCGKNMLVYAVPVDEFDRLESVAFKRYKRFDSNSYNNQFL